ncbi:MAG: heparan-alpha-glucosaminide N-acetyltransferase [Chloroflexota bacterium]
MNHAKQARLWEIDSMRGVVIITMTIFHLMWNLYTFRVLPDVVLWAGFWKYFQRFTACTFIFLVGVSLTISYRRAMQKAAERQTDTQSPTGDIHTNAPSLFSKFLMRGFRVFGLGMIITIVVSVAGMGYVHFGVLHLIGFAIVAAYPFLSFKWSNLALWAIFQVAGNFLQLVRFQSIGLFWQATGEPGLQVTNIEAVWFSWLGLIPTQYFPNDYFPIVPWFGVVLLGVFVGNTFYDEQGRKFLLPDFSNIYPIRFLRFLGRNSLLIYMIHQPILFVLLALLGIIDVGLY